MKQSRIAQLLGTHFCGAAALASVCVTLPAQAQTSDPMGSTKYVQLTGDFNGDGLNDVLMKAIPEMFFIPLDDDIIIPISKPTPSPTFALLSGQHDQYSLVSSPDSAVVSSAAWKTGTHGLTFSGATGDLAGVVSIAATAADQRSFVVTMSPGGLLKLADISAPVPRCD